MGSFLRDVMFQIEDQIGYVKRGYRDLLHDLEQRRPYQNCIQFTFYLGSDPDPLALKDTRDLLREIIWI